jgi:hypothetical protein
VGHHSGLSFAGDIPVALRRILYSSHPEIWYHRFLECSTKPVRVSVDFASLLMHSRRTRTSLVSLGTTSCEIKFWGLEVARHHFCLCIIYPVTSTPFSVPLQIFLPSQRVQSRIISEWWLSVPNLRKFAEPNLPAWRT